MKLNGVAINVGINSSVHNKFVAFGFSTKDMVVNESNRVFVEAKIFLTKDSRRKVGK